MNKILLAICLLSSLANPCLAAIEAQWMLPTENAHANMWFAYRKSFELPSAPGKAIAEIACDSKYWLWLNGELIVREGQLKRGPTRDSTYIDQVDLTSKLKPGKNTIAILQWYYGKQGFSHNSSGAPGMFFELNAGDVSVVSDNSWKVIPHAAYKDLGAPQPNYRLPESSVMFDARLEMENWWTPEFDDSAWQTPTLAGKRGSAPWGPLEARPIPQWKDWGVKTYPKMGKPTRQGEYRIYTLKLPYNAQVQPILEVDAREGLFIGIETDNTVVGGVDCLRGGYITKEGVQTYEHLPWISGHEVIYKLPDGVKLISFKYRETGYDTELVGKWKSDDKRLDELWQRAFRTLYVNMRDTYFDCPDRERAQWWGDVVVQLGQNVYLFDYDTGQSLLRKGIRELARWQRADGVIYSPVPAGWPSDWPNHKARSDGHWTKELPYQMLASVGWYGFWRYYEFTGDQDTIQTVYPHVKQYLGLWKLDDQGVTLPRETSWVWVDWGKNFDEPVLASCWHYLALKAAAEMAKVSGAEKDVAAYQQKMASIKKHFHSTYWQGTHYMSSGHEGEIDDRANAMAVVAGLAPAEVYSQIRTVLNREMHASPYMEKYVEEALFLMGYPEDGLKRMKDRYRGMLDLPMTTLPEHFALKGGSDNHAWSGGPLTLMEEFVAGIYPIKPAFETYRIRPALATLNRIENTVATAKGPLSLSLEQKDKSFHLTLTPPENTVGEIHIPNPGGKAVSEISINGAVAWKDSQSVPHADVTWVRHDNGYEVFSNVKSAIKVIAK